MFDDLCLAAYPGDFAGCRKDWLKYATNMWFNKALEICKGQREKDFCKRYEGSDKLYGFLKKIELPVKTNLFPHFKKMKWAHKIRANKLMG